ncbi:MAG: hypothetical protein ACRDJN_06960 [Chloroflexota bacterium]
MLRATVAAPRLDLFEDPPLAARADQAVRIAGLEPGDLVDGLSAKWAVQAQGLAAAVLVATVWPVAAAVLVGVWLVDGRRLQADLHRAAPDRGRVVEAGSHHDLIVGGGLYAELFELQARSYR